MAYIGTFGDVDPNYQTRRLQNASSALQFALSTADRKKREQEAERDREIARFAELAERYPDAAETYGEHLVSRYGSEVPYLRGMVDAVNNREAIRDQAEAVGQRWIKGVESREAPLREIVANPTDWRAPMLTPEMAEGRIRQIPSEVAGELPFADRLAARVWAKDRGYDFPKAPVQFDPLVHSTQSGKQRYGAYAGLDPTPGAREAAEIAAGMRPSASAEQSAALRREEGERAKQRIDLDVAAQELAAKRLALDERKEARIAREAAASGGGKKPDPWKGYASDLKEYAELEADRRVLEAEDFRNRAKGVPKKDEDKEKQATASKLRGSYLKISDSQSRFAERKARELVEGGVPLGHAMSVIEDRVRLYQERVITGETPYKAWKEVWKD